MINNTKTKRTKAISKFRCNVLEGFSLLELLVAVTIVSILSTYGIWSFRRNVAQGEVDRYTQFVESGLFSLKARLAQFKDSCVLVLDQDLNIDTFGPPWKLLEFQKSDGTQVGSERLLCCEDDTEEENPIKCTKEKLDNKPRFRLLVIEGTRESKQVEVAALQPNEDVAGENEDVECDVKGFEEETCVSLSPSGTVAEGKSLTFLIRSLHSANDSRLRTRCVELSGSGHIHSGTWNQETKFCDSS